MDIVIGFIEYFTFVILTVAIISVVARFVVKNIKLIAACTLMVSITLAAIVFLPYVTQ